jgi:antitoxin ParD1/3/4
MSTINISLPDSLKAFVEEQVAERGYTTNGEYVREVLRKEQERLHLRSIVLEGAASPPSAPADSAYFAALRGRAR